MKKKGFTLIELLAVIVVLAIIAVIATPLVLNTIEDARKGAFEQTLTSIVKASELYQAREEISNPIVECRYFSFNNDVDEVTTRDDKVYYPIKDLALKGDLPTEGEVKICKDEIVVEASNGSYAGRTDKDGTTISKGDLASNDLTTPIIDTFSAAATTNKITVSVAAHSESVGGIIANYYYKIDDGEYIKTTDSSYIFEGLSPDTEYTITIKVENKSGRTKEESKTVTTKGFGELVISISNPGTWETSKTVTITGEENIEYQIVKYAGSEIVSVGEWLSYSEPFTIEEEATLENPIVVRARYNDGQNITSPITQTITTIDTTTPSLTTGTITKTTNSMKIPYTATDSESDIKSTTCVYGTSTSYGLTGTVSDGTCTMSNLKDNTTYYYKLVTTNNAGLTKEVTGSSDSGIFGTCSVEITPSGWSTSKTATITGVTEGAQLQYKVNSGSWTNISSGGTVTLTEDATSTNPTTVYCRFNDGTNTTDGSSSATTTKIDTTPPSISTGTVSKTTNSISIEFIATDSESDIKETTCEYGLTESYGSTGVIENNTCKMTGLDDAQKYYYRITTTNNGGLSNSITGDSDSGTFGTCGVEITPSEWSTSKTATITGVTEGAQLQYKVNSGSWTNISSGGTVTLTAQATSTNPTTVYCRFNDGVNTTDGNNSATTTKIDTTPPTLTLGTVDTTTSTINIQYARSDGDSNIKETTCKYGIVQGDYGNNAQNVYETNCTLKDLNSNTKYYYEVCTTDNVGNSTCKTGEAYTNIDIFSSATRNNSIIGNIYKAGFTTATTMVTSESVNSDTVIVDYNDYLHFFSSYDGTSLYAYSSNPIDVTNLKKLKYQILVHRNCEDQQFLTEFHYGLSSTKDELNYNFDISSKFTLAKEAMTSELETVEIDVSGISGNKYLKFITYHGTEYYYCTSFAKLYNVEGVY